MLASALLDFRSKVTSPLKNMLANALVTFTRKSTHLSRMCLQVHFWLSFRSHFTSQERACKCTGDFHSQVAPPLSSSNSGRLATVARLSLVVQSSCSCKLDAAIRCHTSCCAGCPLWAWFYWCSHSALASLILPSGATHPAAQDTHCGLGFARGAVSAQILPQGATRPTGQGHTLLSLLFPLLCVA